MLKSLAPFIIAVTAALVWLLLSEPGSKMVTGWLQPWRAVGPEVGRIAELEGHFKAVRDGQVHEYQAPLAASIPVHSGDRIEVAADSSAVLVLNSQDEIQLSALTTVILQLWNERDPASAIYVSVLDGTTELRKAGVKGKAYIVRDGRLYSPGQKVLNRAMALTVLKNAPLDMQLADSGMDENTANAAAEFEPGPLEEENESAPGKQFGVEPQTLSNELIDETIASRQSFLQKCWLSRVKDNPTMKGQMVVQFEITRRGRVKDAKIADSSLDDEALKKCVIAVFERITFRTFKGSEISISYPLQFE